MRIQLKKGRDGAPNLTCIRADGTRTWGKVHPFFPLHDLTHYAVESVLGFDQAFFGLVASGWALDDFADKAARARMPAEALWAENVVGLLDLERGAGRMTTAEELSTGLGEALAKQGVAPFRAITEPELARMRALRSRLSAQWTALAPGETLEVSFPAAVTAG